MWLPGRPFRTADVRDIFWYRTAPSGVANPHHVPSARAINRFNDGATGYRLLYFAQDPGTALIEARALLGLVPGPLAPAAPSPRSWTIFRYRIRLGPNRVVDFGQPENREAIDTTVQELTGDWAGYGIRRLAVPPILPITDREIHAPTQRLGVWFARHLRHNYLGFLSPSARNPVVQNLVLFYDRIPTDSVIVTGISHVTV